MKKASIALILFFALISCKKGSSNDPVPDDPNVVKLSRTDTAKIIAIQKGKIIAITLGNPGDDGYLFNTWHYDATILHLDSHEHTLAADPSLVGNFGTDTWRFSTLQVGTTTVHMSASRSKTDSLNMFNHIIKVE